jgi:hypothetical protein
MQLGAVELIAAIEEEFGVHIPHDDVLRFERLGDIHDWLYELLHRTLDLSESEIWERLQRVVVREVGLPPREVIKCARLIEDLDAD